MKMRINRSMMFVKLFLAICMIFSISEAVCIAETNESLQQRLSILLAEHQISLGDDRVVNPNKHLGIITLNHIEHITQNAMTEQTFSDQEKTGVIYTWSNQEHSAEIVLMHMKSQRSAQEWAFRILLLTDAGRTKGGKNIRVSTSIIGDLCILPQQITDDPHGFNMDGSDKTFIIVVRDNTIVFVDSKRNAAPQISVTRIAQEIDTILMNQERASQ